MLADKAGAACHHDSHDTPWVGCKRLTSRAIAAVSLSRASNCWAREDHSRLPACRLARDDQLAQSLRTDCTASAKSLAAGSAHKPQSNSSTTPTVPFPGYRAVTTGRPLAIASATTRGKPSRWLVIISTRDPARSSYFRSSLTRPGSSILARLAE